MGIWDALAQSNNSLFSNLVSAREPEICSVEAGGRERWRVTLL